MRVCLDERADRQDLLKKQERLRLLTLSRSHIVRYAGNLVNQKYIGIALMPEKRNHLGMKPNLPEQKLLEDLKPYLAKVSSIVIQDYNISRSQPPLIFVHPQHYDELLHAMANYFTLQCRSLDVLADSVSYLNQGGEVKPVLAIIDHLTEQVQSWFTSPPDNLKYAKEIIKSIQRASLRKNYKRLEPVKAKLMYLKGLIHLDGIFDLKSNTNQAKIFFQEAALAGELQASLVLGEISYGDINEIDQSALADSIAFLQAIDWYKKAGVLGVYPLSEISHLCYWQYFEKGDFRTANQYLSLIEDLYQKYPDAKLIVTNDNLVSERKYFDIIKRSIDETLLIEAHYIPCQSEDYDKQEQRFLKITNKLHDDSDSPTFDFYYFSILDKVLKFDTSLDEASKKTIKNKKEKLRQKLLDVSQYSDARLGEIYYIYGLILRDRIKGFEGDLTEKRQKVYFALAVDNMFHVAYSHLANIVQVDGTAKREEIGEYYMKGALAGDARAQISYYHQFLVMELQSAIESEDDTQVLTVCQKMLQVLRLVYYNPLRVAESKMIEDYISFTYYQIAKILLRSSLLNEEQWQGIEFLKPLQDVMDEFQLKLEQYDSELPLVEKQRIANPQTLIAELDEINAVTARTMRSMHYVPEKRSDDDDSPHIYMLATYLLRLITQTENCIEIIEKEQSKSRLSYLLSIDDEKFKEMKQEFLHEEGHMDEEYFNEYMNPQHHLTETFTAIWKNSVLSKKPFAEFLAKSHDLTLDVPRVIYLNDYQKSLLRVSRSENGTIVQPNVRGAAPNIVPDGSYIYVLDRKGRLYIENYQKIIRRDPSSLFSHASIARGEPVRCAGELEIKKNEISMIDNASGHYKPTVSQLGDALDVLQKLGFINVALDNVKIGVYGLKDIPDLSNDELYRLTIKQFMSHQASFIKHEQRTRDLTVFANMIEKNRSRWDEDPIAGNTLQVRSFELYIKYYCLAKKLVQQLKQKIESIEWVPSLFKPIASTISGYNLEPPAQESMKMQIILQAEGDHDWYNAAIELNLINSATDTMPENTQLNDDDSNASPSILVASPGSNG